MEKEELIDYFKSVGLIVRTTTKARGHQGFYLKNRIDISSVTPKDRIIPTLLHEFTHFVHSKIEPYMEKSGGTLERIFNDNKTDKYFQELLDVTHFVDKNSKFEKLNSHKVIIKSKIKDYEKLIKNTYPKFLRSKKFKEFDKYIKRSQARYLLKYDRVKLVTGFLFKGTRILSTESIENDFPDMPPEFTAYIRLKSCQKKLARISSKISRLKKYYSKPTELFARFVEGLYIDKEQVETLAPVSYKRFCELLESGYYPYLQDILMLVL